MMRTPKQKVKYWVWRVGRVGLIAYTLIVVGFGLVVLKSHAGRAMETYYPAQQVYQPASMVIRK